MTEHRRDRPAGLGFALLAALAFGASGPLARPLIDAGLDPLHVAWLRVTGAALFLLPVALRRRAALRRHPWLLLAYGVFPMAGIQAFYFAALARIPVGVALLLEFLGPVLVLLWLRVVRRRRVSRQAVVGVILAVAGLTLLVEAFTGGGGLDPIGIALALVAAACQAAFFLLSDAGGPDVDPPAVIAYGAIVGSLVLVPIVQPWSLPWELVGGTVDVAGLAMPAPALLAWLCVVSTSVAYLAGVGAVRRLSAPIAGAVAYLEVVTAIALAWLLLGETLSLPQTVGAVVVVLGAFIAQLAVPTESGPNDPALVSPASSGPRVSGVAATDPAAGIPAAVDPAAVNSTAVGSEPSRVTSSPPDPAIGVMRPRTRATPPSEPPAGDTVRTGCPDPAGEDVPR
ncbi:drug/metabolite transporter (DMT)-like permease [Actinoalloteichus hoggarensis]|uniref:Threonine/homoserine exporter RhtA n=1 Tax=Actinoalloteichus hoggarensis TaxID=1470176 RepID=A0A221W5K8_9PSEU|nr:EamA family transporter [Actinoalloteichus hoggarensis]ASO20993.1 Threonine/homoserine exporter RhtA [Actinoalloteichus hoggarensis]MBB5920924.1 drug/metabolite transporter (DMT)-like permease [Actinoalloteichus hoggarensis]